MSVVYYEKLTPKYFEQVIKLGNDVHGDGYLNADNIADWTARGISNNINCGYVALLKNSAAIASEEKVIGFRITFSAENWRPDQWCSPKLWRVEKDKCCYFKCNTVDDNYRGLGVGKKLLLLSIAEAKKQGALAGVSHLWQQSPNNSAIAYFTRCGGELVKLHPDKWNEDSKQGYNCTICGYDCHCVAAEMVIYFE
jgi:GNAT superfamily N-acetyltransferase